MPAQTGSTSAACRFPPDTPEVTVAEEIERVVPVVERVAAASDIVISVDTYRPEVAARSLTRVLR
jgi:dihydropteroate synthase